MRCRSNTTETFARFIDIIKIWKLQRSVFIILTIISFFPVGLFADQHHATILMRRNAGDPIKHGIHVLATELEKHHYSLDILAKKDFPRVNGTAIYVGNISNYLNNEAARKLDINVPMQENSYVIRVIKEKIYIYGSDDIGAMYGAYDVSEQLQWADRFEKITDVVQEKTEIPFVRIRGLNAFLHTQALADTSSWFFNMDFWREYLDQLSFNRFNFLDIHGVYDIYNTDFYNFFAYFVKPAGFSNVGLSERVCAKNLAMLKKIILMAKKRGIRTGIMSYNMDSFVGGQPRPGRFRDDPKITLKKLQGENLEAYLREATATFLKAVPDLWIFGFRMGESGKRLDFFEDTFVKGVQQAGRKGMPIYSRSWLTTRRIVDDLAKHYPGPLFVEIKYNGEQAGPPYHAITGMRPWHLSYSYEEYSDRPQNFSILWQIRFNGSHRIFHWGDAEFVKRAVQTLHFANGSGFTIEPMQAYFPLNDFFHNKKRVNHNYFQWGFQKDWLWNILWGRLSYDPDTDSRAWTHEAEKKFGARAAKNVLEILSTSSQVIPLIMQTHCLGVDHRAMAAEFETGNGINYDFKPSENGYDKGINGFIKVAALDSQSYMSVKEYVAEQIERNYTGRHTPVDVSGQFQKIAHHIFDLVQATDPMIDGNEEYECIRMDAEALAQLAMYYSEKMLAAVNLEMYNQTHDFSKIQPALDHAKNAYAHWQNLSQITEKHYRPLVEELRMRTNAFTWKSQLAYLKADIQTIEKAHDELQHFLANFQGLEIAHLPIRRTDLHAKIEIVATLLYHQANIVLQPRMQLFYRVKGQKDFHEQQMLPTNDGFSFRTIIPQKWTDKSAKIEYYLHASLLGKNVVWPTSGEKFPAIIDVSDDFQPPTVQYNMKNPEIPADEFIIKAHISDTSGVKSVRVLYKLQPSYLEWKSKDMKNVNGDEYQVVLPLSARGLMFHFEAFDNHNNGTRYPDSESATPYYVIESWDSSKRE